MAAAGYYFSIPSVVTRSESFKKVRWSAHTHHTLRDTPIRGLGVIERVDHLMARCGLSRCGRQLVRELPMELILTETDSPYQGPEKVRVG
jgi:hypothetical protein